MKADKEDFETEFAKISKEDVAAFAGPLREAAQRLIAERIKNGMSPPCALIVSQMALSALLGESVMSYFELAVKLSPARRENIYQRVAVESWNEIRRIAAEELQKLRN